VILLNKDLQMERILVDHLSNNPCCLCYVRCSGKLFIGESCNYISVFIVSFPPGSD